MRRLIFFIVCALNSTISVFCQNYSVSGKILDNKNKIPVEFARISLKDGGSWAIADEEGRFVIKNVTKGRLVLVVQSLGYETKTFEVPLENDIKDLDLFIDKSTLALDEVVVTAKLKEDLSASYIMDRTVLDHMQMLNVSDVSSLLPGGKTNTNQDLAKSSPQRFNIIGDDAYASFGVGVEVDGVRISNNAGYDVSSLTDPNSAYQTGGPDVRNIASTNVESIEIITGIPSAEHGDLSNGMVRINTRKGKSPYIIDMSTKPHTKQVALSKGYSLGHTAGVLNINIEYTKSVSNLVSPYTAYDRNGLSLNYSNTFNQKRNQPVIFNFGVSGNLGGYDSKSDPDYFADTYVKQKDNNVRANLSLKYLLNKTWITNIEAKATVNYSDKLTERNENKSASSSTASIRTPEQGYHVGELYADNPDADIILIPPGYWYQLSYRDNKPLNYSTSIKANWNKRIKSITNNFILGGEFTSSGNKGRGIYYDDMQYAPTWREYRFDKEPFMNNYAFYAEDKITIPFNDGKYFQLMTGVRSDITSIKNSAYKTVSSFSPRLNAKYALWTGRKDQAVRSLSFRGGWGRAVKLPSFLILYPRPSYLDIQTFAPGTTSDGKTFYAYYTMPREQLYNPDLKWQFNQQAEIGLDADIKGIKVMLTASVNTIFNPYVESTIYNPFTYKLTDQRHLENSFIPIEDRIYSVDNLTGIVTVRDKTGLNNDEILAFEERTRATTSKTYVNGSPIKRRQLNWIVDFGMIPSLKTSLRWDGSYSYYRTVEKTILASMPNSLQNMADGNPYKYIGFYAGGSSSSNGDLNKNLNTNLTITTHIPAIRMIISLRLESTLYSHSQYLSEYNGERGFVLDGKNEYLPSELGGSIYDGDKYVGLYPEYYVSFDDPETKIPFMEKFLWAKDNDPALYNELAKLVSKTNTNYYFNERKLSAYYSANLNITKEIGDIASITFNATNFFYNMMKVKNTWDDSESSLYDSSTIPKFYYGLSLKIKI